MVFEITDNITWVGKADWEIRTFEGEEVSTHKGSTYNSYLIRDKKTVLVDTVWGPFAKEFVRSLKQEIDLKEIDYIIANHSEPDHSGALSELLKEIPDTPVYCTANGEKFLKGLYHEEWNFNVVKTGDKLNIGSKDILFIEAPMLHWPDSMMVYLTGDEILFSNDAFGQHYASSEMYNDKVDQSELYYEALKYYANIVAPFGRMVDRKIKELQELNVPISMICPSHGVIWRNEPMQIVNKYLEWANNYSENLVTVFYDTMWDATRNMAESIAEGIKEADENLTVKVYNVSKYDKSDVIAEIFKSKAVAAGSPTIHRGILSSMAGILEGLKGLSFKDKKAAAFGAFGWSGESVDIIDEMLSDCGYQIVNEGLRLGWYPDEQAVEKCREFGRQLVSNMRE